jgi:hypothetical protein
MTLCLAAIAPGDQSIVTASDLMLSDDCAFLSSSRGPGVA